MSAFNDKYIRQNTEPIDYFTLTDKNMIEGYRSDPNDCPVALSICDAYERVQYEDVHVTRYEVEFGCQGHTFSKVNSWTLWALVQKIDFPDIPIHAKNQETGEMTELFKDTFPLPVKIEEYESLFNAVIPGFPKTMFDDWDAHTHIKDEKIQGTIIEYTPYKWEE